MLSASEALKASGCSASWWPNRAWKCQARRVRKVSSALRSSGCADSTRARRRPPSPAPAASTTAATSWSTSIVPPRSGLSATRSPGSVPLTGGAKFAPGSASASGTRASGPAMTLSNSATSPTVRPIGPPTEVVSHWFSLGHSGTLPRLGRRPTTPQNDAGLRSDPPMSDPSASGTMPAARAHAGSPAGPARAAAGIDRVEGGPEDRVEGVATRPRTPARSSCRSARPPRPGSARRSARRAAARGRRTGASRRSSATPPPRGCP